jgi:mRNA interferase MazF
MKRGDVVRVDLPAPMGPSGREQLGTKPAIVVQQSPVETSTVVVVPLTSNLQARRFAGSVEIPATTSNGLSVTSIALVSQVRAVDKKRVQATLGKLDPPTMADVDSELRNLLGL